MQKETIEKQEIIDKLQLVLENDARVVCCARYFSGKALQVRTTSGEVFRMSIVKVEDDLRGVALIEKASRNCNASNS